MTLKSKAINLDGYMYNLVLAWKKHGDVKMQIYDYRFYILPHLRNNFDLVFWQKLSTLPQDKIDFAMQVLEPIIEKENSTTYDA